MRSFYELVRHEGNQDLFRAVEMSIAALSSGHPFHIHSEGLRGTGKTTILRSAASILPPITRIKGCLYNCDPQQPHCPEHRALSARQIAAIGSEDIPCPFLEISHGAKISTIVGSIDLARLTDPNQPLAALLPGTIPQAHRGIIFVDEINRLADAAPEIADVLLDVMGTKPGRIQIEESGLPTVELPIQVTVWAASNPDEEPGALAQIRKQLSDRFDLAVGMGRPSEVQSVLDILLSRSGKQPLGGGRPIPRIPMSGIAVDDDTRKLLAAIYVDYGLESLRAVEAMETAARLNALLIGHDRVSSHDVAQIVPLVLSHRTDPATIANILKFLSSGFYKPLQQNTIAAGTVAANSSPSERAQPAAAKNRLTAWWDRLMENLSGKGNKGKAAPPRSNGSAGGSGGAGRNQIADPSQVKMMAPPTIADPLARLSIDEYVHTDENSQNR